jgi:hypothetical protein
MIDDIWSNPQDEAPLGTVSATGTDFVAYTTAPSWDNTTWFESNMSSYLGAVTTELIQAGYSSKYLIFNGINEAPSYPGGQYLGTQSIGTPPTPTILSDGF